MGFPPSPGPGPYSLTLATPAFYLLAGVLGVFVALLVLLHHWYPNRKRGLEGYVEAAGIDIAFLVFAVVLVVTLADRDPNGNRTAISLYRVILGGYWLAFSIPVVTIGSSVHSRSRGSIPWLWPSLAAVALLFGGLFAFYFTVA
ncbi:MAG: hypothetical protein L3J96_05800 [Thermoplasmata archaeon]|nr:hypothetical protein [Thermoplasmata archaeon]